MQSDSRVDRCWGIYFKSVTLSILVNAGIVKGDDSVRKDDWFEVTYVGTSVIPNKTFDYLSVSQG